MPQTNLFPNIDGRKTIPDDLGIVRYMSLQALMMILTGRVFIPSIKSLRQMDPLESLLPWKFTRDFPSRCLKLHKKKNAKWLAQRPASSPNQNDQARAETWLRELAIRRCVWCWFGSAEESMGLWNAYAPKGVAVISSIARVRKAAMDYTTGTSAGWVRYVDQQGISNNRSALYRPYYFKHKCYSYEREIRFVIGSHAGDTLELGGDLFQIDPNELIAEVILSPQFRVSEAKAMDKMLRERFPWISVSLSPLLSAQELPELRPAGEVSINLISTDPIEKRLFGVV
jgi:hypothetical protein